MNLEYCKKIVITGGPGGGKTTALDLFQRELNDKLAVVPEAASILFKGGMPRSDQFDVLQITQKTIYDVQKSLENIQECLNPHKLLICDRGTLDGVAYWPGSQEDFFKAIESSFEQELDRYDAVIFFETAAKTGNEIDNNNIIRTESKQQAVELDNKLKAIWSKHPNFHFVGSNESFIKKIMFGIMTIENVFGRNS